MSRKNALYLLVVHLTRPRLQPIAAAALPQVPPGFGNSICRLPARTVYRACNRQRAHDADPNVTHQGNPTPFPACLTSGRTHDTVKEGGQ